MVYTTVYVPHDASPLKVDNIRDFGPDIETVEGDALAAERKARHVAEQQGVPFISLYNDMDVMEAKAVLPWSYWLINQLSMPCLSRLAAVG